uniref:Uncharacterized protein n=1 Tax=Arundo donax TaxID=35708 RepID=A0A0A9APZ7_ARUDO
MAAAASPSSRVGVAPDVPTGSSAALGRRRLGELAVEVGAREAVAPPGAPEIADLPGGRRRGAARARAEAIVNALVAESPVGLYVHGRRRVRVCCAREQIIREVYEGRSLGFGGRSGGEVG